MDKEFEDFLRQELKLPEKTNEEIVSDVVGTYGTVIDSYEELRSRGLEADMARMIVMKIVQSAMEKEIFNEGN